MNKIPVGVLGASGYAGRELCALIVQHPRFSLSFATANEQRGQSMRVGRQHLTFAANDDVSLDRVGLVFSALPHGASLPWVERARAAGTRVVDLSSDLRPGNGQETMGAVYGMPELGTSTRTAIRSAPVVANPGCYPTSILLALAPLVRARLVVAGGAIVVNASSGVSGAGNSPKRELLFAEVADDYRAYAVGNVHRHLNEMRATMTALGGDADLIFTPHLLPVPRGILSTITVPLIAPLEDPVAFFRDTYASEPYIEVVDEQPMLRDVLRRNVVRLTATMIAGMRTPTVLVTSALDNLVKGAAGQALQNANLMFALDECAGLPP